MSNVVSEIGGLNLKGNVVDHEWFNYITFSNGKPHIVAIMVLSEIVYWYRPTVIRDEITGKVTYKKKFKADKLQKNYQQLADTFGFSKLQVKRACDLLTDMLLIKIEFRTINVDGKVLNNVMFVEPVASEIKKISSMYQQIEIDPPYFEVKRDPTSKLPPSLLESKDPPYFEVRTNTENTTEITTNIDDDDNPHPLIDLQFKNSLEHLMKNSIPLSVIAEQELGEFCDLFGSELVNAAVDKALDENAPRWTYIRTILSNWQKNNVKTLADVIKLDEDYKNRRGGVGNAAHRKRTGRGYAASRNYEEENANRKRNMPSFIKRV
ncbi:DnaD domain protein [Bacillus cytotoxicus]|uniref:Primosome, DnaD subunit n=2 Tax=Bacillus cytotoxicus TaxID=580165 RepID=A0AAX2CJ92_9BACI|nr:MULTISPECIES: DnaD domain protein [Bacillus cereus group]ABS22850.1 primosome, DnaD subunit [Bacillus cytotoxicus NVH 391-98]AWC29505.1 DnaD domain protein [Bacillus cytotoxicus]AWC33518.1 DnaD domain protein [Bacillus cytotoxicus]AWC37495.1 DnaD domain protein [Bacillus cytotoxicus]AWC41636.1 DnaD domain protein [Bacillus cytotoxicus]